MPRNSKLYNSSLFSLGNELEEKIRKCSEILEAFGNAKTVRNDNSSRFGKYTKIYIDIENYTIIGAEMMTYLLEKSRVVEPNKLERNYHIFYELIFGANPELLSSLFLISNPEVYKYLNASNIFKVKGFDDTKMFKELLIAFKILNFSENEVNQIFKIIASVLLLGNLEFEENKNSGPETSCVVIKNKENVLQNISTLLDCEKEKLEKCLLYKSQYFNVEKRFIFSPLQMREAIINKNIFAKELFDRLFKWIVNKLNESLSNRKSEYSEDKLKYIGLLDIFGFECFDNNSIEQFCINYTNEKLQQIFIVDVFKSDEREFKAEGLDQYLTEIKYSDNQEVIELMENDNKAKLGIFQILDDKCLMMASNDDNLFTDILKKFEKHQKFKYLKIKKNYFQIIHTAKTVEYNLEGFIFKNKDKVEISLLEIMQKVNLINWNMKNGLEVDKDKFLGSKFRTEIKELMKELNSCYRHYIRCLKPNDERIKEVIAPCFVFNQIRYLGILDSIRIRKENFPKRIPFKEFYFKYNEFLELYKPRDGIYHFNLKPLKEIIDLDDKNTYFIDGCLTILDEFFNDRKNYECLIGKTKLYLMQNFNYRIELELNKLIEKKIVFVNRIKFYYKRFRLNESIFFLKIILLRILLRRISYQKKYKEMCKKRIRDSLKTSFYSKIILEFKKTSVLRKIQYFLFFKKLKCFVYRKEALFLAKISFNQIIENVIKIVKSNEIEKILLAMIKNYYKYKVRERAFKAINLLKKFKYTFKKEIFYNKLFKKNQAQKIIAKNWLVIYLKRKVILNRINEYLLEDKNETENININTNMILFPYLTNPKIEECDDNFVEINTHYRLATGKNPELLNRNINYNPKIPIFDYYGEPKIVLFAKILNMDIIVNIIKN